MAEHECERCGKTFDSKRGLSVHQAQAHEGEEETGDSGNGSGVPQTVSFTLRHALIGVFILGLAVGFSGGMLVSPGTALTGAKTAETTNDNPSPSPSDTGDTQKQGDTQQNDNQDSIDPSKIKIEGEPTMGDKNAPVTMVMYEDFECPFCQRFEQGAVPQIVSNYVESGQVRLVWKDFPLTQLHPWAKPAAATMECVYRQDESAFWAVKDKLFNNQNAVSTSNVREKIKTWAAEEGVSKSAVDSCLENGNPMQEVDEDIQEGRSLGVSGTPTSFINGQKIVGAQPYSRFKTVIENQLN